MCEGQRTRNSGFFDALAQILPWAGCFRPSLSGLRCLELVLRTARLDRAAWRKALTLSPSSFSVRTRVARAELARRRGEFDVILQYGTLFSPGVPPPSEPYAVFTDNIFALTHRHYPRWAPLSNRDARRFAELERRTFEHAAVTFVKSRFVGSAVVNEYGISADRVVVVGTGANNHRPLLPSNGERYGARRALFVGYEFERKGGETLLAAWEQVRRTLPDAELRIVGPEPRSDAHGVRWLGRIGDERRLEELYDEASVFVMPSLFEPFGTVFVEAMARGLPCIGADCCAMPELIQPGRTGLLVAPGDAGELAEALIVLLSDPERAERYGREAHRTILDGWLWRHVAARVADVVIRDVAGSRLA
jgi:glycosyltransferase involved in cell wall biosynthesis